MKWKRLKIFLLTCLGLLCLTQTGCADKQRETPDVLTMTARPYVKLYDYQSMTVDSSELELTQDDLDAIILAELSFYGIYKTVEERVALQEDDIAVLDIVITVDGEVIADDSQYAYMVGSEELPQPFDERLKKLTLGESAKFSVLFPKDFQFYELAEKSADCRVTLRKICSFITLNDVQEIQAYYGLDSMDEVYQRVESEARQMMLSDHVYILTVENSVITDIPVEGETYIASVIAQYEQAAKTRNMNLDQYLETEFDTTLEELQGETENHFCEFMILKAITEQEGITYTREDYEGWLLALAKESGISVEQAGMMYSPLDVAFDVIYEDVKAILLKYTSVVDQGGPE